MGNSKNSPPPILVIAGPTACGKTSLGLKAAAKLNGEIVSADSVQVYRHFDIGAAKPSAAELMTIPHHLVSCLEPHEEFNAGVFRQMADRMITEISDRGVLPIVVGGTGLYIQALIHGLAEPFIEPEENSQERGDEKKNCFVEFSEPLEYPYQDGFAAVQAIPGQSNLDKEDVRSQLHDQLREIDPVAAAHLHPHDKVRIRRALAVRLTSGVSFRSMTMAHRWGGCNYRALVILIVPQRSSLYRNIDRRAEQMLEMGLVDEVAELVKCYAPSADRWELRVDDLPKPFSSIGYRQVVEYLAGRLAEKELSSSIARATRRFAKRQLTWWRNAPQKLNWYSLDRSFPDAVLRDTGESCLDFGQSVIECPELFSYFPTGAGVNFLVVGSGLAL